MRYFCQISPTIRYNPRMTMRVDNVPWRWKPLYWIFGYGLGGLLLLLVLILRVTNRVRIEGKENIPEGGFVAATWHRNNFPLFVSFFLAYQNVVCLNHPAAFMKPIHVLMNSQGMKLILGSTGENGTEAAAQVIDHLKRGASTYLNPDGPLGPPGTLRKGALQMARDSGLPLLPVEILCPFSVKLSKTWDGKRVPLPLGRLTVRVGPPLVVTKGNFEECVQKLPALLGPPVL